MVRHCADGSFVEFDRGRFDAWCVYVTRPGGGRQAPRDVDYFTSLQQLHARHPRLLDDFVTVFAAAGGGVDPAVNRSISEMASAYPLGVRFEVEVLLATLYAAMIAEENREHAPLGKRIKRLGVHQVLVEGMSAGEAASFSRGKPWRDLEALCVVRGF